MNMICRPRHLGARDFFMPSGSSLYENPVRPTSVHGGSRIFAQVAYRTVREAQTCPVVHTEGLKLAALYPICWLAGGRRPALIALRSLRTDGAGYPPGIAAIPSALPLALQAYPFVVGRDAVRGDGAGIMLDNVIADEPTDVGAPILTPQGKLTRGAEVRLQAAAAFTNGLEFTEALTDALVAEECLERWQIDPAALPQEASVPDLLVIAPAEKVAARLFQVVHRLGASAGTFISVHRISLFRISVLVQAAKGTDSSLKHAVGQR
jgi:SapC